MSDFKVLCCSSNIGNTQMSTENLKTWVPEKGTVDGVQYDLVSVGMQESVFTVVAESESGNTQYETTKPPGEAVDDEEEGFGFPDSDDEEPKAETASESGADSSTPNTKSQGGWGALMTDKFNSKCSQYIKTKLQTVLGKDYVLKEDTRVWQMRIYVFVHKKHDANVKKEGIEKGKENTGLAGIGGNKGGQAIKINAYGTTLCFISCHLPAHEGQKHCEERNDAVREIFAGLHLGLRELDVASQYHHCFFMGDLNYRIDYSIEKPELSHSGKSKDQKKELKAKKWQEVHDLVQKIENNDGAQAAIDTLYKCDELQGCLDRQEVLLGFETWKPTFSPTFKVIRWRPNEYVKNRIPSYCDRVLLKSLPGYKDKIDQIMYQSCKEYVSSDHKPIRAGFSIKEYHRSLPAKPKHRCFKVVLSDIHITLEGKAALADGKGNQPDPYLKVLSDPPLYVQDDDGRKPRSKVVKNSVDADLGELEFWLLASEEELKHCHLILVAMDSDVGADDAIGSLSIPADKISKDPSNPLTVSYNDSDPDTYFAFNGQKAGTMSFKIHMRLVEKTEAKASKGRGFFSKLKKLGS
eukprot:m.50393 g.50393  ORF g.50393 m.50393 type:complete len:579 (-) comp10667_c0_seq2:163-1899(-)